MNAVVFFSNTGQSRAVAEYFSEKLSYPLMDISDTADSHFEDLVLVFPVHCQNIPRTVSLFLQRTSIKNLTAVATYGRMNCGNVLYEIQKKYSVNMVAGAYIPAKHAYIENDPPVGDLDMLISVIEKIKAPSPIVLPRLSKNFFANIFPSLRSRLGVTLRRTTDCDGCGICTSCCPVGAMNGGTTNSRCIRCLRCVYACPKGALKSRLRLPMRLYLRKKKDTRTVIYV